MNTIKELVETDLSTQLGNKTYNRHFSSYEYSGACPWCDGTDRFHVYPDASDIPGVGTLGYFLCMDSTSGGRSGCGRKGDGLEYLEQKRGLSFVDACHELGIDPKKLIDYRRSQKGLSPSERTSRPRHVEKAMGDASSAWQERADSIVALARQRLASHYGDEARAYLYERGLGESICNDAEIGYCPAYAFDDATKWGYEPGSIVEKVLLPKGIVIPWRDAAGCVVCIRFRRLPSDESEEARKYYGIDKQTGQIKRYRHIKGSSSQHLYRSDALFPGCDAALFEGELDALIALQEVDASVSIVASGSTAWARSEETTRRLVACSQVLVCYDADPGGDKGASYWLATLKNARRWRPLWSDANNMARDGINVGEWLSIGLTPASALDHGEMAEPSAFCSQCALLVDYYVPDESEPSGLKAYCDEHYRGHVARLAVDLVTSVFGNVRVVEVFRKDEYTLDDRLAELQLQSRNNQKLQQISPRRRTKVNVA